jgi:hypothetical protein
MNKRRVLSFASILLAACVPYVTSYPKIEAPNADYLHLGCQSELGPKTLVYYPFHGIHISIGLVGNRFGLHIPSGTIVELTGRTIEISGLIGTTPYHVTTTLRAIAHKSVGTGYVPAQFMESIDHYTTPDNFGPLEGGGGEYPLWYLYLMGNTEEARSVFVIPKGLTEGTIEIPAMTINGQHYKSQKLTFKREIYVGMAALNC